MKAIGWVALLVILIVIAVPIFADTTSDVTLTPGDLGAIGNLIQISEGRMKTYIDQRALGSSGGDLNGTADDLKSDFHKTADNIATQVGATLDDKLSTTETNIETKVQDQLQQGLGGLADASTAVSDLKVSIESSISTIIGISYFVVILNIAMLVLIAMMFFRGRSASAQPKEQAVQPPTFQRPAKSALDNYVTNALRSGASPSQIREHLLKAGYMPSEIDKALGV